MSTGCWAAGAASGLEPNIQLWIPSLYKINARRRWAECPRAACVVRGLTSSGTRIACPAPPMRLRGTPRRHDRLGPGGGSGGWRPGPWPDPAALRGRHGPRGACDVGSGRCVEGVYAAETVEHEVLVFRVVIRLKISKRQKTTATNSARVPGFAVNSTSDLARGPRRGRKQWQEGASHGRTSLQRKPGGLAYSSPAICTHTQIT